MAEAKTNKNTILVVDDQFVSRTILKKVFSNQYEVLEAENGLKALDILRDRMDIAVVVLDIVMPELDGFGVLAAMQNDERLKQIPVIVMTASADEETQMKALSSGAMDVLTKPINPGVTLKRVENLIARMEAVRLSERNSSIERDLLQADTDEISGIYNKNAFLRRASQYLNQHPNGDYILERWDIDNFKVYNDIFGTEEGNEYLRRIGSYYLNNAKNVPGLILYARYEADHFVTLRDAAYFDPEETVRRIQDYFANTKQQTFNFSPRIGLYRIDNETKDVTLMCDRALLALKSIKNDYDKRYAWFKSIMRDSLMREHEIVNQMRSALKEGQFKVYFQPQVNYTTGALTGAEALVRWIHPEKGIISPGDFIPIFEKNGFIFELDTFIWEEVCNYMNQWKQRGIQTPPISISVNISQKDLYQPDIVDRIIILPKKYDISPSELHLEITESAYIDNPERLIQIVMRLREAGFRVEMDDFGSGYSSLNTLKNVPVDMLKLDMKFLSSKSEDSSKGGKILSAIIRMANEIDLPVIAEGVETKAQADFLKSIGCHFMQGFFFSRPVPPSEFEKILKMHSLGNEEVVDKTVGVDGTADFMDATTQSTLLFNSFVGGAAILEYSGGNVAAIRLNDKFFETIGINRQDYDQIRFHILDRFNEENRTIFINALEKAIQTYQETDCEVASKPFTENGRVIWTHCRFRCLTRKAESDLFYLSLENITKRKNLELRNEMYRNITLNLPVGTAMFEVDKTIRPIYMSSRAVKMLGYTPMEYKQRIRSGLPIDLSTIQSYYPADALERLKDGETVEIPQILIARKDGSHLWMRIFAHMAKREKTPSFLYATLSDITRQISMEDESNAIAASIPGGIFKIATDEPLSFEYISDNLLSMLDFSRDEFNEKFHGVFPNLIYQEDRDIVLEKIRKNISAKSPSFVFEFQMQSKSDELKWALTTGRRVSDSEGKISYVMVAIDISEQKKMEKNLLSGKQELENVINAIPGGVASYEIRPKGFKMVYASNGLSALTGQTPEEYRIQIN